MFSNISFGILSIIYIVFLMWAFFRKSHIESLELKIFKNLLVTSFVGLFMELLLNLAIIFLSESNIFTILLSKIFLIFFIVFPMLIFGYVVAISKGEEFYIENSKKLKLSKLVVVVFTSILMFCLPIYIEGGSNPYSHGPAVNCIYIYSSIIIFLCIGLLIKNRKVVREKNYIPLIFYIFITFVVAIIQKINPALTLSTSCDALLLYIMYFTVENPDMKLNRELQIARNHAEKANAAKTEFLSSMSHEIRTPLNAIVGFSDCILESETLAEAKDNAADIVNASETLLEIVNGILDISKIEAGRVEIVNTKYNAPNTYLELAKLISPKMLEKGLDFSYNIAPDLPNVLLGDHANIKKIVTNLLSNACKYTDRGFVHYEVNCVNSGGVCKLIISVEDSGRGIKKESVDKMFTKFQRLDEDKNTTIEGTGLGLAITKQLTELMGGRIIVHTVYGQGSKFTVVINQKIGNSDVVENKKIKTTLDLANVKLLIVDDNQLNLKVATKLFEKFNANCITTCESGFECIDKIKSGEEYDIILLDDMMPKKSGVETLKELKMLPGFNIPVVALTANAISGMREKYLSEGFNDYLAKPIEKNEFIRVCNEILGRTNTEEIEIITPVVEKVREEIIVADDRLPEIIPVEDNIEEILGSKVEIGREQIIVNEDLSVQAEEVELLDDFVHDDIVIPELVPVVDININTSSYDQTYLLNNGVDLNHALELLGDIEMYNMTINDFMTEIDDKWSRINTYKDNKDMENYAIDVHSLKSDCKYLGFMKLADVSYQHELKSKENDLDYVLEHFNELEEEYYKMYDIAKNYAEHNKSE